MASLFAPTCNTITYSCMQLIFMQRIITIFVLHVQIRMMQEFKIMKDEREKNNLLRKKVSLPIILRLRVI